MRKKAAQKEKAHRKNPSIRRQMYLVYVFVLLIPICLVGVAMISYVSRMMVNHYEELLDSENMRVKTFFTELTTQIYNTSDDICYNSGIKHLLSTEYESISEFGATVNQYSGIDDILYESESMESIFIYTDNPTIGNYKQYRKVTEEIEEAEWYQRALSQNGAFWITGERKVNQVNKYNLCLVRRMNLGESDYCAVVMILISDSYIRSRIDSNVIDAISVDDSGIVYSSRRSWYGETLFEVDREQNYYSYSGTAEIDGKKYLASITKMTPDMTSSDIYIYTFSSGGFEEMNRIIHMLTLILILAIGVPGTILVLYTTLFTRRVSLLREEIHRASNRDYELRPVIRGKDELAQAYGDLQVMVQTIKEQDNQVYEAQLNEQELRSEQQRVEYKMLASQINPHFLYNTLETIRMMALTAGNRDVADAVRTLGKTLRYVLDNTGTTSTELINELNHIENYLKIQKLRFGDRINYQLIVAKSVDPTRCRILPLLLQPVVENAVVHGLEGVEEQGQIVMEIKTGEKDGYAINDYGHDNPEQDNHDQDNFEPERLIITVSDNGLGMSPERLAEVRQKLNNGIDPASPSRPSIGLYNISQRIHLSYGETYGLTVDSTEGEGTVVTIIIPVVSA